MAEEEMEKRGVSCSCADNPGSKPKDIVKTASGCEECRHCGKKNNIDNDKKEQ